MAAFADLAPLCYFPVRDPSALRAVGWLEPGRAFPTGQVGREFFDKLCGLLVSPWQPFASAGRARCGLCQFSGGPDTLTNGDVVVHMGAANLFVPGVGVIYATPSLVAHYIDAHHYAPPAEFVEAVERCPPTRSMEYRRRLLANGGKGLLAPATSL